MKTFSRLLILFSFVTAAFALAQSPNEAVSPLPSASIPPGPRPTATVTPLQTSPQPTATVTPLPSASPAGTQPQTTNTVTPTPTP